MQKLPVLSGREVIKLLAKVGFEPKRRKGSHVILVKEKNPLLFPTIKRSIKEHWWR